MNAYIRVAVIDRQPLFRDGICHAVSASNRCELVAEGSHRRDAIQIARKFKPQIMLIGANLPGGGIEDLPAILQVSQEIRVIILAAIASGDDLSASLQAGAKGYAEKGVNAVQLIDIVSAVHGGALYAEPTVASQLVLDGRQQSSNELNLLNSLTPREHEILTLVAKSLTNKEIARCYNIAEKTVKHYMTSILQKLQARNRVEAALIAQKTLMPQPPH